ncbi:ABC transporter permease [Fictibacillus nanhaiensis]|uniref:ABC transporter permease n=1 Tax=Fictibacillus nanhaiensis TaxID=742169 RepID=A0ABS2ZMG4_9BACL|nr:ABC transporter permease [Fictibacillus nanhaiensis]
MFMAEFKKSHFLYFHTNMIYFSLLVWPIILFFSAYYSFKPFDTKSENVLSEYVSNQEIGSFLLIGYLGYIFYFSLMQSAFQMAPERARGTLELIFLSPVSRLAVIYGRAMANLLEGVWLFFVFTVLGLFFFGDIQPHNWWGIPLSLFLLIISAVVWGGFLNAIFLFSRDAGFFFLIIQEPLLLFSGVRIPIPVLPIWGKFISYLFPLSYVLLIYREIVMRGASLFEVSTMIYSLLVVIIVFILLTSWIIRKAEKNSKINGSMALY